MILDYNPARETFVLRLPRGEGDPTEFRMEYGLDFFQGSPPHEAMLFTKEPYAAASFYKVATAPAKLQLGPILTEIERSWAPDCGRHIEVPEDKELWPFQRASVDYCLNRPHALVADEPGLGKTPIGICIANEMQAKRVLVVCPAAIRFQWVRRIKEWSTMEKGLVYAITSSRGGVHDNAAWTVISWDLVRSPGIGRALAKGEYDLLILDEAHYAKSTDAARTRAIFGGGKAPPFDPLSSRAERVVALTGTPLPNRPREAYTLARGLCWEAIDWLSEDAFKERFNPTRQGETPDGRVYVDERVGRTAELQNRLRANFMVRHLKRDVMTQLKLPVYDLVRVEETRAVKQALAAESLLGIDPEHLEGADAKILGQIATARRRMGVAMAPQVADYVRVLVEGGEDKLVLFAWHIEVLDILCRELQPLGVVRVDGSDGARSKDLKVQKFIKDPALRIIVGNVLSLGTGTDGLQHVSTHALIAEPDWVPANNQQCIDRLDRGGQKGQVQADLFVAPNSIAEKILASALRKLQTIHNTLDRRVA